MSVRYQQPPKTMLHIDIVSCSGISSNALSSAQPQRGPDACIVIKFGGRKLHETEILKDNKDPQYEKSSFQVRTDNLVSKERENFRPFYLEHLDVEVVDFSRSNIGEKIGESRIPLSKTGLHCYKIVKCNTGGVENASDMFLSGKLEIKLAYEQLNEDGSDLFRLQLSSLLPPSEPQYQHLFFNFSDWSPSSLMGLHILPGPLLGEQVIDRHADIEWNISTHVNAFGDRTSMCIRGFLIVTDLRIILLPNEISGSEWLDDQISIAAESQDYITPDEIVTLRRCTVQIPIGSIEDIKVVAVDIRTSNLVINCRDGSNFEFIVHNYGSKIKKYRSPVVDFTLLHEKLLQQAKSRNSSYIYRCGLATDDIIPQVWCARVVDYIQWSIREDCVWSKWLQYWKLTMDTYFPKSESLWLKFSNNIVELEREFQRQRVQDGNWMFSEANNRYQICSSYPQTLVIPGLLVDDDIVLASVERSKGRVAALVWLHPSNQAALCRAAQPMSGIAGKATEADKKMCLAIKASGSMGKPLRIADARPRLNANANALQGKGFENIAFLGGPSVASLVFLDIENIHVMRSSFLKLKEGLLVHSPEYDDSITSSKWLYHISAVLKGSVAIAESLLMGYPILVHCSDGWDRTSQLSALSQLLLDPYYRTLEGYLVLLNKEFAAFGHQFEERLGKSTGKETSPVFIQFLDATWQLIYQFPQEFEFTAYLLTFILQSSFSGYFSTFRGNHDMDRHRWLRLSSRIENIPSIDLPYSSLFCYLSILVTMSPIYHGLLINPFYRPKMTCAHGRICSYIRPRCGVNDLKLWREGLLGFSPDIISFIVGNPYPSQQENIAMTALRLQRSTIEPTVASGYDRLNSVPNLLSPHSVLCSRWKKMTDLDTVRAHLSFLYSVEEFRVLQAAIKIFCWWRFRRWFNRYWRDLVCAMNTGLESPLVGVVGHHPSTFTLRSIETFLSILGHRRHLLSFYEHLLNIKIHRDIISNILDDILDESLSHCIRSQEMSKPELEAVFASMLNQPIPTTFETISNSTKSLSARFSGSSFSSSSSSSSVSSSTSASNSSSNANSMNSSSANSSPRPKSSMEKMLNILGGGFVPK